MATKAVTKPQLRGLLTKEAKKHLIIGSILSIATGVAYKYLVTEPRRRVYAEFYKNYDAEKEFQRMKNLGIFDSC